VVQEKSGIEKDVLAFFEAKDGATKSDLLIEDMSLKRGYTLY